MERELEQAVQGGFNFDLCRRNAMLESRGVKLPKFRKTGTTIAGVVYKVRLRADCSLMHRGIFFRV